MSRSVPTDTLPPTARAIALLLASTPSIHDAQPGVLHQLLEFSHRYTSQVLSDALVYAEHAGRAGKIEMDDVVLAIQARVGWEFGGRVPKEYTLSLASQTNSVPLPSVPEVFGVRLPPASSCLTSVDFDLVPNKPPPNAKFYEEVEEVEEEEEEDFEDYSHEGTTQMQPDTMMRDVSEAAGPVGAMRTPSDADMASPTAGALVADNGSDIGEDDLFEGDDNSEGEDGGDAADGHNMNGVKRKLVEEDDYD